MAESLLLPSLKIKNFRAFDDLEVSTLGRVNLIVGKNNVGKTSLLEAVWLWASRGDYRIIENLVDQRDGASVVTQHIDFPVSREERHLFQKTISMYLGISSLFSGFPPVSAERPPIVISSSNVSLILNYQLSKNHLPHREDFENFDFDSIPTLLISFDDQEIYQTCLGTNGRMKIISRLDNADTHQTSKFRIPAIHYLSPRIDSSFSVKRQWNRSLINGRIDDIVAGMKTIDNNIHEIFFVDDQSLDFSVAVCRHSEFSRPIPLRSLGDGVIRFFHILLALANTDDGVLLIDEFENGLHYRIQPKAWEVIFEMAKRLNVQVFATTHSADTVRSFEQTAMQQDDENAGVVVQLARWDVRNIANPIFGEFIEMMYDSVEDLR